MATNRSSDVRLAIGWMFIPALIGAFIVWTVTGRQLPVNSTVVLPPLGALLFALFFGSVVATTTAGRSSLVHAGKSLCVGAFLGVAVLIGAILIGCGFIATFGPDAEWLPMLDWTSIPVANAVLFGILWGGIPAAGAGICFAREVRGRRRLEQTRDRRLASGSRSAV